MGFDLVFWVVPASSLHPIHLFLCFHPFPPGFGSSHRCGRLRCAPWRSFSGKGVLAGGTCHQLVPSAGCAPAPTCPGAACFWPPNAGWLFISETASLSWVSFERKCSPQLLPPGRPTLQLDFSAQPCFVPLLSEVLIAKKYLSSQTPYGHLLLENTPSHSQLPILHAQPVSNMYNELEKSGYPRMYNLSCVSPRPPLASRDLVLNLFQEQ